MRKNIFKIILIIVFVILVFSFLHTKTTLAGNTVWCFNFPNDCYNIDPECGKTIFCQAPTNYYAVCEKNEAQRCPVSTGCGAYFGEECRYIPLPIVNLTTNPSSGTAPLSVNLTATVSGPATGPIDYYFYCVNDDSWDYMFLSQSQTTKTVTCAYNNVGTYTAKVKVIRPSEGDEYRAIQRDEDTAIITVGGDTTPPTCSIHYPCNSSYGSCSDATTWINSTTGYIKLDEADNTGGSGIDASSGHVDKRVSTNKGATWGSWINNIKTGIENFSTTLTNCYYYNFRYGVKDNAGNACSDTKGWQLRVDTADPSADISYPTYNDANPSTSTSIPITLTESDVCSGVASGKVQYKVKDLGASTWPSSWTDLKNTTTDWNYTGLVGKCYKFQYQTTDNAGNTSAWDNPNNMFCINTTPPTVNIKARPSGSGTYSDGPININYNTKADLRWTVTDATSCTASGDWSGSKTASGTTTETTANLTANKTYTITCSNGVGGTDSDSVTVNVGDPTLFVAFSADKTSGSSPLTGVTFTATVSGSAIGTINYTFYCNRNDSGTNITTPYSYKIDGTNINPLTLANTCDSVYTAPGTYYAKMIVERDSATPVEARITIVVTNNPPTATNLKVVPSNACLVAPYYACSWTYTDPDNDDESQFLFQVDDNSDFSSPVIDRTIDIDFPSPSSNNQPAILSTIPSPDHILFNTRYYWRVKVVDAYGMSSAWVNGASFITPLHHSPIVRFTNKPLRPIVHELTWFTDDSRCFDDSPTGGDCAITSGDSFNWTFVNGNPATSTKEIEITEFTVPGTSSSAKLQVTDSDGFTCSLTKSIKVNFPPPIWKEVRPTD